MYKLLHVPSDLTTKGELADYLYGKDESITAYDCAVPQEWIKFATSRGFDDPARHVVTCYTTKEGVRIMPVTDTGVHMLCTLATHAAWD